MGFGTSAPAVNGAPKKMKFSEKEKARFEALIKKASTLKEVQMLEKAYAEGRLPQGVADADAMDET